MAIKDKNLPSKSAPTPEEVRKLIKLGGGSGGSAVWGDIQGELQDQEDLATVLEKLSESLELRLVTDDVTYESSVSDPKTKIGEIKIKDTTYEVYIPTSQIAVVWGQIQGSLSSQTDLNDALNGKMAVDGVSYTDKIGSTGTTNIGDLTINGVTIPVYAKSSFNPTVHEVTVTSTAELKTALDNVPAGGLCVIIWVDTDTTVPEVSAPFICTTEGMTWQPVGSYITFSSAEENVPCLIEDIFYDIGQSKFMIHYWKTTDFATELSKEFTTPDTEYPAKVYYYTY